MGEHSAISWCDNTFNPWIGCTRVSPACDHCYAATLNSKRGRWVPDWGSGAQRHRTATSIRAQPLAWERKAMRTGYRPKVFCASLADVFGNEVPQAWRNDLWTLVRATPHLRWMMLTKRIGNAPKMLPPDWPFKNVGLMATLENQRIWDRDFRKLMAVTAE